MAWRAISGFLFKDFWFPFAASHVVTPVGVPTTACKTLCARTTDCCRWAVRDVRSWGDAKDADSGLSELGWVIAGDDINLLPKAAKLVDNVWCIGAAACPAVPGAGVGPVVAHAQLFTVAGHVAGAIKQLVFRPFMVAATTIQTVNVPGDNGVNSFYVLMLLTNKGIYLYDHTGQIQHTFLSPNALTLLKEDPNIGKGVTFVRSFSCGLFKKETSAAKLAVEALPGKLGLLEKCGGTQKETKCKDSNCDPEAALAAQMERLENGKWSQDALAESHGVSFASIACAVIASVALVFIVLSVAKKNSHLEVAVADE